MIRHYNILKKQIMQAQNILIIIKVLMLVLKNVNKIYNVLGLDILMKAVMEDVRFYLQSTCMIVIAKIMIQLSI